MNIVKFRSLLACLMVITVLFLYGADVYAESLFALGQRSLFTDRRARSVGDLVTILISENAQATNAAQTTTGKGVSASANIKAATPSVNGSLALNNSYRGNESTTRRGALNARMTATIEQVLPNGDFIVVGSRTITVNNEKQELTIRGTVRPGDIGSDNSIPSGMVGNAEIRFKGSPDWQKSNGILENTWEGVKAFFSWLF